MTNWIDPPPKRHIENLIFAIKPCLKSELLWLLIESRYNTLSFLTQVTAELENFILPLLLRVRRSLPGPIF